MKAARRLVVETTTADPLSSKSDDQLLTLRNELEDQKADIDASLAAVRAERMASGNYADPRWYAQQTTESKRLGRRVRDVCTELARRRKRRRVRQLAEYFVDVARELLDRETFTTILDMAHDRHDRAAKP